MVSFIAFVAKKPLKAFAEKDRGSDKVRRVGGGWG